MLQDLQCGAPPPGSKRRVQHPRRHDYGGIGPEEHKAVGHSRPDAGHLGPYNYQPWLDPPFSDTASVSEMLRPFEAGRMRRYPLSTRVNQAQNDDAECAKPLEREPSPAQGQLF
jgi:hypothetical protein